MAVTGKVFAVTNLEALFDSYVSRPNAPDAETFAPVPNARVQLRSGLPLIPLSVEAVTGCRGAWAHDRADRGWWVA